MADRRYATDSLPVKVGDKITTWFSGREDEQSTVVKVLPYHGKYPNWYDCTVVLTAPETKKGTLEMAYRSRPWSMKAYMEDRRKRDAVQR